MPACVSFDPVTSFLPTSPRYDFDDSALMDAKKLAAALFSPQFYNQNDQLMTPPASPRLVRHAPFDYVPNEILDQIIGLLHSDTRRGIYAVLRDISACCLVSRQFYAVAVTWLYRHVPISDPYAFTRFLSQLSQYPEKGLLVKTLDFSPFSVVSLGRSANDNKQIKMVCSETLQACLDLVPNLQELLLTEALDPDLDLVVLSKIFDANILPKLEALDFCGSCRPTFVQGFLEMLKSHVDMKTGELLLPFPPLQRLSLHGCQTLPAAVYHHLLPHLPMLTHLDLSLTQIDSLGLLSINPRCLLRHLYLGNCAGISGKSLLKFLLYHPASRRLESLNIRMSDEHYHPVHPDDVPLFLSALRAKGTLKSLDICGMLITDANTLDFPSTLVELGVHRTGISPRGVLSLLSTLPRLFYIDVEANLSGGKLRLSQYADVFTSIRRDHSHVRIVECSGPGVEATDEIYDILLGWHWLHGRSRRGWLVCKAEYDQMRRDNYGMVKLGWKTNKINCCNTREDLHGHYWYYAFGR